MVALFLIASAVFLSDSSSAQSFKTPSGLAPKSLKTCVYFDRVASAPNYKLGDIYAIMTKNLLGHFVEVQTEMRVTADYKSGDLNNCNRAIYLGSYYEAPLSDEFLLDVAAFKRPFFWFNYNIWKLQKLITSDVFANLFGFNFNGFTQFTDKPGIDNQAPGFFQKFYYKGETFNKMSMFKAETRTVIASPEIAMIKVKDAKILSESEHNRTGQKTPYVVRKNNFFYIADIPFSYIHESDRYLIITDVLFDFLDLPERSKKHYAIARIEDIHPEYDLDLMYNVIGTFKKLKTPFAISVIPNFVDPFGYRNGLSDLVSLRDKPEFTKMLKYAVANGGSLILHGVTHQIERSSNCDTGASGDDFEFWDGCRSAPLAIATESWIKGRLKFGIEQFNKAGFQVAAWLPPHYEASQLAYTIFGQIFPRSVQRVRYMPYDVDPSVDKINWAGQFFPYTIYEDYYGQFLWPENLGNVRIPERLIRKEQEEKRRNEAHDHDGGHDHDHGDVKSHDHNLRYPEEIIRSVRQNLVIRDSWASFFWHPQLIGTELGIKSLEDIVKEIKKNNYEFINLYEHQKKGE